MVNRQSGERRAQKSPSPVDKHVGSRNPNAPNDARLQPGEARNALGLTFQQVQKYEKGANRVGAGRLLQIARILGVGVEYFYEACRRVPARRLGT